MFEKHIYASVIGELGMNLFFILCHKHNVVNSNYQIVQKIIASRLHQKK